jgi:hypothetical protein
MSILQSIGLAIHYLLNVNSSQLLLARHSSPRKTLLAAPCNPSNTSTSRNTSLHTHSPSSHHLRPLPPRIMTHKRVLSDPEGPPSPKRPNFTTFARHTFGQRGPTITATIHIPKCAADGGVSTWSNTRKQIIDLATHSCLTFPKEVLDAILMIESYAQHVKCTFLLGYPTPMLMLANERHGIRYVLQSIPCVRPSSPGRACDPCLPEYYY